MPETFVNPSSPLDRFIGLGSSALIVANPVNHALDAITREFSEGGSPPTGALVIPYDSIVSIKANRHRADMNVSYRGDDRERAANVSFASPPDRDRALRLLHRDLRQSFRVREVQYGVIRAVVWPVVTAIVLAAFTWLSVGAARDLANGAEALVRGRHQLAKSLYLLFLEFLGPTGVAFVGVAAIGSAIWWLLLRLRRPPRLVFLSRR